MNLVYLLLRLCLHIVLKNVLDSGVSANVMRKGV